MRVFRWVVFCLAAFIFNLPLLVTLLTSLKTTGQISASPPVWLFVPTLVHYQDVLFGTTLNFPRFLFNSVAIALIGTFLAIFVTLPAAYTMARFRIGSRTLLPFVTNLRTIPLIIFAIPFYLMFQFLGLMDTRLGLGLIAALINLPLALVLFVGFLQDFPVEIEEAARVDGATTLQVFFLIVTPLSRGVVTAVAILSFIYAWNEFLFGLILTTQNATPVTVGATFFVTSFGIRWGQTAAAMILSVIPPAVLGILSYRYLARALVAGAVKG
jgi:multiple sugar transport system permease protein